MAQDLLKKAVLIAAIVGVLYVAGYKLAEALRPVYGGAGAWARGLPYLLPQ